MDQQSNAYGLAAGKCVYANGRNMPDYAAIRPVLPLREAHVTQTGPGHYAFSTRLLVFDDIAFAHAACTFPALSILVDYPGRLLFSMPMRWEGNLRINGHSAQPCQLHMADGDQCIHNAGSAREDLTISVSKSLFLRTVAALTGDREEPAPCEARVLNVAPAAFARLRHAALNALAPSLDGQPGFASRREMSDMVFGAVIDAYLSAQPGAEMIEQVCRYPSRIVRAVEARFEQSPEQSISLADLCRTAGVSKNTLYKAFHSHCEMSPLAYIHKRRLAKARAALVENAPARGAIKRAALSAGLLQLGRFSVEYRELFGESPSATLTGASLAVPAIQR